MSKAGKYFKNILKWCSMRSKDFRCLIIETYLICTFFLGDQLQYILSVTKIHDVQDKTLNYGYK